MFKISIEQKVLIKALEYLEPTVGKNATGLGDNCVAMATTGNGSLEMYTTNTLEFTRLEAIVAVGGNTKDIAPYVDFKRFKTIISSSPANDVVSIEASVNDILISFALKKKPIKLAGCNNGMIPLPTNQFSTSATVTVPNGLVKQATDNVCSIVIDSKASPIYNCMRIFTSGIEVEISALDMTNKRTFIQSGVATNNNPQQEILLEASKLKKSLKLFEDYNELEFYMDQTMVRVDGADPVSALAQKTGGMISNISYFARRVTGAFPSNIKASYVPAPAEFSEINKQELLNCFTRIKAVEDQTNGGIIGFEIDGSNAIISLTSSYGDVEDNIVTENTVSRTFKTMFKYENLSDIMKVIETDTFEIGVLPAHPTNYVIKSKGNNDVMFTVSGMAGASATP